MARIYKIVQFKPTDYKDQYENYWCDVAFEGVSEPAKWSMREESVPKWKEGMEVYGHIEEATSRANKPYNRFKTDKVPEGAPEATPASPGGSKPSGGWTESPEKQQSINRAVALNNASVLFEGLGGGADVTNIIAIADTFYTWLSTSDKAKVEAVLGDTEPVNIDDIPY